jgi:hypothetical protein
MWIIVAWQHILPDVTVKGFKKCCISSAVDGTDVDMLWNGSEEDGNVKSVCVWRMQELNGKDKQNLVCFV